MKWNEVADGTKFKLLQDIYVIAEMDNDYQYQYRTKKEIDDLFALSAKAGTVFAFDANGPELISDGCVMGVPEEIDTALWQNLDGIRYQLVTYTTSQEDLQKLVDFCIKEGIDYEDAESMPECPD